MADRTALIASLEAAVFEMERPVTREQVLEKASEMLKPVDHGAFKSFSEWFEKNGNTLMRLLNG